MFKHSFETKDGKRFKGFIPTADNASDAVKGLGAAVAKAGVKFDDVVSIRLDQVKQDITVTAIAARKTGKNK